MTIRGSHTAAILVLLVILGSGVANTTDSPSSFHVHPFGPFYSARVVQREGWEPSPWDVDTFFGHEVSHVPLLLVIDLMFAGWFLLALVRNTKRDPNYYEIYSPLQALGFAIFLNVLFVAFYNWQHVTFISSPSFQFQRETPIRSQAFLCTLNIVVFFCLGLAAIRNRERVRRILRTREGGGASWLDLAWPVPLMIAGTAVASFIVVLGVAWGRSTEAEWDLNLAMFRALFFVAWITRDVQFLQWMSLRRNKHPLVIGALFLIIFYVCAIILMAPLGVFTRPERTPFSAFFVPSAVYLLNYSKWVLRPAIWAAAFVAQWILVALFVGLQKKAIDELNSPAAAPAAAPVPAQT